MINPHHWRKFEQAQRNFRRLFRIPSTGKRRRRLVHWARETTARLDRCLLLRHEKHFSRPGECNLSSRAEVMQGGIHL